MLTKYIKKLRPGSIFTVNLLSMSALSIICTLILSFFFTQKISWDSRRNMREASRLHLHTVADNTDNVVVDVLHQSVVQLSYSHSILSLATSESIRNQDLNRAAADIAYAQKYNRLIDSVVLYYPKKDVILLSDYSRHSLEDYEDSGMIRSYLDGSCQPVQITNNSKITSLFRWESGYVMALDFPLHGDRRLASLFYRIDMEELGRVVSEAAGDGGTLLVYDGQNDPVFDVQTEDAAAEEKDLLEAFHDTEEPVTSGGNIVFFTRSPVLDWQYLYLVDENRLAFGIREALPAVLPVLISVLLLAVIGSFILSRSLYRPLKNLITRMKGSEHAQAILDASQNEMDYLDLAFSNMDERNERLAGLMSQVADDVTTRLFMELFMGTGRSGTEIREILDEIQSPFRMGAPYVVCVMQSRENLTQNPKMRGTILDELNKVLEELAHKNRILYHVIYAGGQTFGMVLSFDENESTLTIRRYVMMLGERTVERMRRLGASVAFAAGNIYHSIADVGFSYSEAYGRLVEGPRAAESIPDGNETDADGAATEAHNAQDGAEGDRRSGQPVAGDVGESDLSVRIRQAFSLIGEEQPEAAEELMGRIVTHSLSACHTAEEKREFGAAFVNAVSEELVGMRDINMAAFSESLASLTPAYVEGLAEEEMEASLQAAGKEVLQVYARVIKKTRNHFFVAVKEYVQAHFDDGDLSLNMAADAVGANPSYISRLFKEIMGINFTKYLTDCRMRESVNLLAQTDLPVKEIAARCGYSTIQNFMRVFKKYYGKTPGQYRENPDGKPADEQVPGN